MKVLQNPVSVLRRLHNPDMGACDLRLLESLAPSHASIATFRRNPRRYAADILYALLDVTTEDKILKSRNKETSQASAVDDKKPSTTAKKDATAKKDTTAKKDAKKTEKEADKEASPKKKSKKKKSTPTSPGTTS